MKHIIIWLFELVGLTVCSTDRQNVPKREKITNVDSLILQPSTRDSIFRGHASHTSHASHASHYSSIQL